VITRNNLLVYAAGTLLIAIVGLIFADFALQWQPVPAGVPMRTALVYTSNVLLAVLAVAIFLPRISMRAMAALAAFYGIWALVLHVPRIVAAPGNISIWLGLAEILTLAIAGTMAWLTYHPDLLLRWVRATQVTFSLCLLVFGASHFVYADFTATMIPSWMPLPLFWAYFTGCGHVATGISLICDVATRLSTTLLTAMFASFVLLLHVPRVLANLTTHAEWVMLGVATALTGAAWIIRTVTVSTIIERQAFVREPVPR
jgi:uncharacterized membrane protein